jgi:hypothetical protein
MAATGEPYNVAARALDAAEPSAAEPAAANPMAAEGGAGEPSAAEPAAANPMAAEGRAGEPVPAEAAAEPMAVGSVADPTAADPGPVGEPGRVDDPGRVADRAGALAEVIACASRTLAAPSARIQIRDDTDLGQIPERIPRRRRPGLMGRLAGRAATRILGRVAPNMDAAEVREQFLHQFGAGFIEPAAGRYLIDFGGYAQVLVDGHRFGGLSGEPLGPRYELRPHRFRRDDPLDALRALHRATAARWAGTEQVRWTTCRVVVATVDDNEFTVWLDDQHILQFQTVERGSGQFARTVRTETVELWDFGVPVDQLDWSRLPTFRTDRSADRIIEP